MRWVRIPTQSVDNPTIKTAHRVKTFFRQLADIAGIGNIADTETQRINRSVNLAKRRSNYITARPGGFDFAKRLFDAVFIQQCRIARALRLLKAIAKTIGQRFCRRCVHPNINALALCINHGAHIIDTMGLIGMVVAV